MFFDEQVGGFPAKGRAPDGPGLTKCPARAVRRAAPSFGPHWVTLGVMLDLISCRTAAVARLSPTGAAPASGAKALPEPLKIPSSPPPPSRKSCCAHNSRRSTVSPWVRHVSVQRCVSASGRSVAGAARSQSSGSKSSARSDAMARRSDALPSLPSPRGTRASAMVKSRARSPVGLWPKICSPSRIWASLRSHR